MEIVTLKYNKRSKAGKALEALLQALAGLPGLEVVEKEEAHYNPEFVKKIREAEKEIEEGHYKVFDAKDPWGSLGL